MEPVPEKTTYTSQIETGPFTRHYKVRIAPWTNHAKEKEQTKQENTALQQRIQELIQKNTELDGKLKAVTTGGSPTSVPAGFRTQIRGIS